MAVNRMAEWMRATDDADLVPLGVRGVAELVETFSILFENGQTMEIVDALAGMTPLTAAATAAAIAEVLDAKRTAEFVAFLNTLEDDEDAR